MDFMNCTPHTVTVLAKDCATYDTKTKSYTVEGDPKVILSVPASGIIARCDRSDEVIGDIDGIPVITSRFSAVTGLPEAKEGTRYIVSNIVAQALPERSDLVVPAWLVRDKAGAIAGCLAFARII